MADLDRNRILAGLEALGEEDDVTVLEAARDLHAQVSDAGLSWQELLRPEQVENGADLDEPAPQPAAQPAPQPAPEPTPVPADGDDLAMVEALLRRPNLYAGTRDELEDYKQDIESGDFTADDRKYLRALAARLARR